VPGSSAAVGESWRQSDRFDSYRPAAPELERECKAKYIPGWIEVLPAELAA